MSTATEGPQIARLDWIMVGVLGFVWGSTFMVTELALEGMTPFWVAFIRLAFAALPMVLIWRLTRTIRPSCAPWRWPVRSAPRSRFCCCHGRSNS